MKYAKFLSLVFLTALATVLAAQDKPPAGDKGDKKDGDDKGKENLAARVAKNMKTAEERLKNTDPGDVTRKIQRDVVDDLDEMIKQNQKSQSGGQSKKSQQSQAGGKSSSGSPKGGMQQQPNPQEGKGMGEPKPDKQGAEKDNKGTAKGGKEDGQAKDKDKGQDKGGQAKDNGDKDQKNKGETKGPGGKEGGFGTAKRDDAKAKNNLAADLNQDEWGKLPAKMRQLMDVYSKERFMPRYDDLLRQYYRTIAEQSMKKDD